MLIRQSLNFAAHFAAGIAIGALAVAAWKGWRGEAQPVPVELRRTKESPGKTPREES